MIGALPPNHVTPPAARGERWLRHGERALAWLDGWLARWLPPEHNPLAQAGAAANVALLVAMASGVLLLIWYSPSIQFAYTSLAELRGFTAGGWVRALHRYSSDLTMLLLIVHAGRVFFARKFGGARWLPWVSGVAMFGLVWVIGWTGYWLVWDQPAQQVAVSSMRLLDGLPIFGEPLARLYVSDRTVPSLLFFVVFFLHMLLPLAIAIGLAVHLARVSRARLLPRRPLAWSLVGAIAVAALVVPAPLDEPARMAVKASAFTVDAWYLSPLALGLRLQGAGLWLALGGGMLLAALVPWLLGRRRRSESFQAVVNATRCHACTQCLQDCPFDAIAMVPRTDGRSLPSQAQVDPARCVGCGVCAGSCDSEAMTLTWFDTRVQEARIERELVAAAEGGRGRSVALIAADLAGGPAAGRDRWASLLPGYMIQIVPTASWIRPRLLERLFTSGTERVLIVRDASGEPAARDGGRWVTERLTGVRHPSYRVERSGGGRWCVIDFDPARPEALAQAAKELQGDGVGGEFPRRISRLTVGIAATVMMAGLIALAVLPSHLRVDNPASKDPEFVFSFRALGAMEEIGAMDPIAEASKPVHMRGHSTRKPHRKEVSVRISLGGRTTERSYAAKGMARDGAAMGEWRQVLPPGEHLVVVEVFDGATDTARWEGTVRAEMRRVSVLSYDSREGFRVE